MARCPSPRAEGYAALRELAFTKLIETRAHSPRQQPQGGIILRAGRLRDPPRASRRPGRCSHELSVAHGLDLGHRSVDILARVQSSRAKNYVREFTDALAPWRREPAAGDVLHRARLELSIAA